MPGSPAELERLNEGKETNLISRNSEALTDLSDSEGSGSCCDAGDTSTPIPYDDSDEDIGLPSDVLLEMKSNSNNSNNRNSNNSNNSNNRNSSSNNNVMVEVGVWDMPVVYGIPICLVLSHCTFIFSLYFPYVLAPMAATKTYVKAQYRYDATKDTNFDNTPLTWATDYVLVLAMTLLAFANLYANSSRKSLTLRFRSFLLLQGYAISTMAGAFAHQHYTNVPNDLNTTSFRLLWILCVGCVCAAGGFMGSIGTELCRQFHYHHPSQSSSSPPSCWRKLIILPGWFWIIYGAFMTLACALGHISYKRPACDIFIAGITQFVPTFYCVAIILLRKKWPHNVHWIYLILFCIGFLANAPLLPLYPLLVQYTSLSLGQVNAILHAWLFVAWGMQGVSLRHLCQSLKD